MIILDIPKEFQPHYRSSYPGYSAGKNMEEIFYEYFLTYSQKIEALSNC